MQTNLDQSEFEEINARWPEFLASNRAPKDRLFALVSLNAHRKVIDHLLDHHQLSMAVVYCDLWMGRRPWTDSELLNRVVHVYESYGDFLEQHKFVELSRTYRQKALTLKPKGEDKKKKKKKKVQADKQEEGEEKEKEEEEQEEEKVATDSEEKEGQRLNNVDDHQMNEMNVKLWPDEIEMKAEKVYGTTKYFHPVLTDAI